MTYKSLLPLTVLAVALIGGCDFVGEDGVEGVWVEAGLDEDDLSADYIQVTEATLSLYGVYRPLDCLQGGLDTYGLTSSDGTVFTFGDDSRPYRVTQDGDELIVTRSSEPTRYERSRFDPDGAVDCSDLTEPVDRGNWTSTDGQVSLATSSTSAEYFTSYNSVEDCYRSVLYLHLAEADGRRFTYRERGEDRDYEFEVSESGQRVTGPDGVTLIQSGFTSQCF